MARDLGFPVFDSDNHMYETQDAFTRHLPPEYSSTRPGPAGCPLI